MGYRIKTVADMTGVSRSTLIAWERRYGLVSPMRANNGYRMYSDSDVSLLRRVKALVDRGLKISEAIAVLDSRPTEPGREIGSALLARDTARAERILSASSGPFRTLVDEIILPATIHVERHAESRFVKMTAYEWLTECLRSMLRDIEYGPASGIPIIAAGLPGAEHDVVLLGWSVNLAVAGCRVHYLGQRVEPGQLANATRSLRPAIVVQAPPLRETPEALQPYLASVSLDVPIALVGPGATGLAGLTAPGVWVCERWSDLTQAWPRLVRARAF